MTGAGRDPVTPAEWAEAVDAAYVMRCLHDLRLYGLVKGGPDVDAARCDELLRRGTELLDRVEITPADGLQVFGHRCPAALDPCGVPVGSP